MARGQAAFRYQAAHTCLSIVPDGGGPNETLEER